MTLPKHLSKLHSLCISLAESLDKSLARLFSPLEILLIGCLVIGLVLSTPKFKPNYNIPAPIVQILSNSERKIFIPLDSRVKECKNDLDCSVMAQALVYEARSESEIGQVAIAHVILNRVKSHKWSDSVAGVVYAPRQFSYTMSKQENVPSKKDWRKSYLLAWEVLNGMVESPVGDADHYHAKYVKPKWASKLEYVATIGEHKFYK